MLVAIGVFLTLISLLLFTYYQTKANEDDLNRPSFFNSKKRKYFLLFCVVVMFGSGEYLFLREEAYYFIALLPLLFYLGLYFVRKESMQNTIIRKVFTFYEAFSQPSFGFSQEEILIAPVEFMVLYGKMPKDYRDKVHKYLENRIKEGKIKSAKDLPQEAWTIIGSFNKPKIEPDPDNVLPQKKIDYYYEEIIEGKNHKNITKVLLSWLWDAELWLERFFDNFAFISERRPDFTQKEVGLQNVDVSKEMIEKDNTSKEFAIFPEVPLTLAKKFGWVKDSSEYYCLAALEFQRRYPKHKMSKHIKKQHSYSDEEIFDYAQNWKKLDISKIKLFS